MFTRKPTVDPATVDFGDDFLASLHEDEFPNVPPVVNLDDMVKDVGSTGRVQPEVIPDTTYVSNRHFTLAEMYLFDPQRYADTGSFPVVPLPGCSRPGLTREQATELLGTQANIFEMRCQVFDTLVKTAGRADQQYNKHHTTFEDEFHRLLDVEMYVWGAATQRSVDERNQKRAAAERAAEQEQCTRGNTTLHRIRDFAVRHPFWAGFLGRDMLLRIERLGK